MFPPSNVGRPDDRRGLSHEAVPEHGGNVPALPPPQQQPRPSGLLGGLSAAGAPRTPDATTASGGRAMRPLAAPADDEIVDQLYHLNVRLHQVRRASDVVPSLFTQFEVPPRVARGFQLAYDLERYPDRGACPEYRTIEEIAQESGINDHLGFRYGVLNICLEFEDAPNAYLHQCSQSLSHQSEFLINERGNKAHQTLYQIATDMSTDNLNEVVDRTVSIVRQTGMCQFETRGVRHGINDEGMAEIFYDGRPAWLSCANPIIVGLREYAQMPLTTPPGAIINDAFIQKQMDAGNPDILINLSFAGFAEIPGAHEGGIGMLLRSGSRFNAHSTYGKLWPTLLHERHRTAALRAMRPASEGGGRLKYASVYKMGPNGTVVGEPLARIELASAN